LKEKTKNPKRPVDASPKAFLNAQGYILSQREKISMLSWRISTGTNSNHSIK